MPPQNQQITRFSIPLPFRPRTVNAYRVELADGGWMLVDGGVETEDAWLALSAGVQGTGGWDGLRLHLVTHMHLDHIGLARRVRDRFGAPLAMGRLDAERVEHAAANEAEEAAHRQTMLETSGVPQSIREGISELLGRGRALAPHVLPDIRLEGSGIPLAQAPEWEAVWTPGHTAGHICLFRRSDRALIAGDVVIPRVSPTIGVNRQRKDPVTDYVESLDRLHALNPAVVYGGHGEPMNGSSRILELKEEVLAESDRVQNLLGAAPASPWELAEERYRGREVPMGPRLQAVRETLAHLHRLLALRVAGSLSESDGVVRYFQAVR